MKRMEFRKRAYTAPACTVIPVPVESLLLGESPRVHPGQGGGITEHESEHRNGEYDEEGDEELP